MDVETCLLNDGKGVNYYLYTLTQIGNTFRIILLFRLEVWDVIKSLAMIKLRTCFVHAANHIAFYVSDPSVTNGSIHHKGYNGVTY